MNPGIGNIQCVDKNILSDERLANDENMNLQAAILRLRLRLF